MTWQQTEFVLKGIYLGLLLFVAFQQPIPSWVETSFVALYTLGGLILCLGVAALRKMREGYRVRGRWLPFILFLLLENPGLVYAGIVGGLTIGVYAIFLIGRPNTGDEWRDTWQLPAFIVGGAALGIVFYILRHVRAAKIRFWLALGLAAVLVAGGVLFFQFYSDLEAPDRFMIGVLLLLGIPLFYLLTFAGMVEESEIEIAAICAALGIGLWIMSEQLASKQLAGNPHVMSTLALALPLTFYYVYTRRIMPGLRVFKHVLRGISYATVGQFRWSLMSLGRALQLDPNHALARQQLWNVHRQMDFSELVRDTETLALINFEMCLERAAYLLLLTGPKAEHLQEAHRLLDLVASQRPVLAPRVDYWRAVAFTHERKFEAAAAALERVLAGSGTSADNRHRWSVLVPAWQLALLLHPEMKSRVGQPLLEQPGRPMEAIAAVERQLAQNADDAVAWDLKRLLYNDLTEAEYATALVDNKPPAHFDHTYVKELGLALIDDETRWQRGGEYLRMAACGLPLEGPALYVKIAKACERAGRNNEVWQNYEMAQRVGRAVGPKNLSTEDRHLFFAIVKVLGEDAKKRDDLDAAVENYLLYSEYERAGLETYRTLAELYERKQQPWAALHATEQGLVYDARDTDLVARKDKYYYSVTPQELESRLENVRKWFDIEYCKQKARWILDKGGEDLDNLDWASHLIDLAQVVQPTSLAVRFLKARILRRRGEVDQGVALLEEIRNNKPEKFPSAEEEEAWFLSCRLLGDIYLDDKPDVAVQCFLDYRKSPKSGADTMYKLGRAYENLGDRSRAVKCYQQVVAFESHPLAPDAHSALQRLQAPA
jgi:tetratricopeptide (TPR) repeat protein